MKYKYQLGEIVCLDPTQHQNGPPVRISGHVTWEEGVVGYFISYVKFGSDGVRRDIVNETDLCPLKEPKK